MHTNIANFLRVIPSIYGVKSTDRVYQGMSTAFDFSVEEIWPTWIAGATLVAGPTDSRRLGQGLTTFLILTEYGMALLVSIPVLWLSMALHSWSIAIPLIIGTFLFASLLSLLVPPLAGRLLMGNVRPGLYPLWGATYLRWWLYGKLAALSPAGMLAGSPWISPYLRLLGAKVGQHCYLASSTVNMPMFLEIEDDVSIGYGVQLQPYTVEAGWLRIAPIHIGRDAFIGTNSVVLAGAKIGSHAAIAEQSLVSADQIIPNNEPWGGSPSKCQQSVRDLLNMMAARTDHNR
jgi:non-ribosomal peptide synthetase-like protein